MKDFSFVHRVEFQMPVYCIISDERGHHIKLPQMYNRVLKKMGLHGVCVSFMVAQENLGRAIEGLRVLNISGANITAPYNKQAAQFMDTLSEGAKATGTMNTVVCKEGKLKGYNTNAIGFMEALAQAGFKGAGKRALVFGTGDTARTAAFILNWLLAEEVIVVGRNLEQTRAMAKQVGGRFMTMEDINDHAISVDIVVNATSVSSPDESMEMAQQIDRLNVTGCELIYDLNYGRSENFWRQRAKALNVPFIDGLSALVFEARYIFYLWTGKKVLLENFIAALN